MKSFSIPGAVTRSLLLLSLLTPVVSAKLVSYRYLRFHPVQLKDPSINLVQLSEFQFFNGANRIPNAGTVVSDQGALVSTTETPAMAYDNYLQSKWLNNAYFSAYLQFDFGTAKSIDSYNFTTAGDVPGRDPISWTIEGSNDSNTWTPVDSVSGFATPDGRYQAASPTNFVFPATAKPSIPNFEFSNTAQQFMVANDTQVELYYATSNATSVKITADNGAQVYSSTTGLDGDFPRITPVPNRQAVYTLSATNAGGTATRTLTIRASAPQTQSFRYVRYTPLQLRGGSTTVQLSEFNFKKSGSNIPILSVVDPGGSNPATATEGVNNLIDAKTATKWLSTKLSPLTFDLGAGATFDSYNFTTANDFSDRDPVRWLMEGSNDQSTWTTIENITPGIYQTTAGRLTVSDDIPLSLAALPVSGTLTSNKTFVAAGDPVTLTYTTSGASSVSISPSVSTSGSSGTVTLSPTTTTTYTLTATNAASGRTATSTVTVKVATPTGTVNFTNFDGNTDIALVGGAQIINDFAHFPNAPNASRIRLTEARPSQSGAAWSASKLKVTDGFESTFDVQITSPDFANGGEGISFVIQNTADGYAAKNSSLLMLTGSAVNITLDSNALYNILSDNSPSNGETNANLIVYNGTSNPLKVYNLNSAGLKIAKGYKGDFLTTKPTADPYHVKVSYTPGALSVYVNDILVADKLAVNLATAADANGKAYLGFNSVSGSFIANQDILNWTVTPSATVSVPLAITSSAFTFGASPQLALTFSTTSGKTYRITQSTDLVTWTAVGADTVATSASTSVNVPFTAGDKGFFRVEQVN